MNTTKLAEKTFCTINFLALTEEQYEFLLSFYNVEDKKGLRKYLKVSRNISRIYVYADYSVLFPLNTDFEAIRPLLIAKRAKEAELQRVENEKLRLKAKKWLKENKTKYPDFVLPLMARRNGIEYKFLPKKMVAQKGLLLEEKHNTNLFKRITNMAYSRCNWGRLRKTYHGSNSLYAGIKTVTNGKSGWDCVSWHYAYFTAIINPQKTKVWVQYPDKSVDIITVWKNFAKIDGKIHKFQSEEVTTISQETKRYILEHFNRGNVLNVVKDSKEDFCYQDRETQELYHFNNEISEWRTRNPFTIALSAFKKRRKIAKEQELQKALEKRCFDNLYRIYVTVQDSLQSGNCVSHTISTRDSLFKELGIDIGTEMAVRADILIKYRDDFYSRRAVWHSFMSHYNGKSLAW